MGGTSSKTLALVALGVCGAVGLLGGCNYTPHAAPVDLKALAEPPVVGEGVRTAIERAPTAGFPASIAVVQIENPRWNYGPYVSAVSNPAIESLVGNCRKLPMVNSVTTINNLGVNTATSKEVTFMDRLREAAASVRADLLLVATMTTNHSNNDVAPPVGLLTLGLFPTKVRSTETNAALILVDTRTGYVYTMAEARDEAEQLANGWTDSMASDDARSRSERRAGEKLITRFEESWTKVINEHAAKPAAGAMGR